MSLVHAQDKVLVSVLLIMKFLSKRFLVGVPKTLHRIELCLNFTDVNTVSLFCFTQLICMLLNNVFHELFMGGCLILEFLLITSVTSVELIFKILQLSNICILVTLLLLVYFEQVKSVRLLLSLHLFV